MEHHKNLTENLELPVLKNKILLHLHMPPMHHAWLQKHEINFLNAQGDEQNHFEQKIELVQSMFLL